MRADALPYDASSGRPWGLAATLGLSLAIWYALELLQAAMGFGMEQVLARLRLVAPEENTQALNFAIITCISTVQRRLVPNMSTSGDHRGLITHGRYNRLV